VTDASGGVIDASDEQATDEPAPPVPEDRRARVALWAFVAYLVVAWFVLVFDLGGDRWFFRDDWHFLAGRDGGSVSDVFRPHAELHPVAVPVVVYRLLFNAFGLDFTPYLIVIVTMHLGVAALLRVVMRRADVGPWLATVAAGSLVLFGRGEENILWPFQIGFVGALLLGLSQLVLSDHDGPFQRRDLLGVLCGIGAVMSTGMGLFMIVAVGLANLARRGWRAAFVHTGPPAAVYGIWTLVTHPEGTSSRAPAAAVWDWVREGQASTAKALGGSSLAAVLLAALLVAGLGAFVSSTPRAELRRRAAVPLALLVCGPIFFAVTAQSRWFLGLQAARSTRYLYVGAVFVLPALALAGEALARRWRFAAWPVALLLLIGIPGNIEAFELTFFGPSYFQQQRAIVLGVPRTAEADDVPRSVLPMNDRAAGPYLTIGWLLDLRDAGDLPEVDGIPPRIAATFPIHLGLVPTTERFVGTECETGSAAIDLSLARGDRLAIHEEVWVATAADGERTSARVRFPGFPRGRRSYVIELPSLDLRFEPIVPGDSITICR
jgi:MFS family permease